MKSSVELLYLGFIFGFMIGMFLPTLPMNFTGKFIESRDYKENLISIFNSKCKFQRVMEYNIICYNLKEKEIETFLNFNATVKKSGNFSYIKVPLYVKVKILGWQGE